MAFHGPRSATVGSSKSSVHVDRLVGLPRPAFLELLDEAHDRGVPFRERDFVGEVGCRHRRDDERHHREQRNEGGSQEPGHERARFSQSG